MEIRLTSVLVNDQSRALEFYTSVLGFQKRNDIPLGEFRWLTVVSPNDPDDIELLLEPNINPAARVYQAAMFEQGLPLASFFVTDIDAECERLKQAGVKFRMEPTCIGESTAAMFEDTCGNVIQIYMI